MNLNMLYETVRQALKNIASNKFRTLLTMLGIIIGIMAVILIVGLGNGMTQSMRDAFSSMGTNTLTVSVPGFGSRTVDVDEMYALAGENTDLFEGVSPVVSLSGSVKVGSATLDQTSASGVSEDYLEMSGYTVSKGRGLQYLDMDDNKKVCVVGAYIERVGYGGNALGQTIKVGADQYTIVGVLEARVSDLSSQEGSDDDVIFVPYTTALRAAMSRTANSYTFTLVDEDQASEGKAVIEQTLTELFHSSDGFMVMSMSEMLDTMTSMVNMVIMVLTVIAGHLPAGGRHRHHEHHDGLRHRAHPGDRHPQGAGRQRAVHPGPVCHRGVHDLGPGRRHRHRAGLSGLGRGQPGAAAAPDGYGPDHQPVAQLGGCCLRHLGGHRHPVRLPARQAGGPAQPHRRAALRLTPPRALPLSPAARRDETSEEYDP